MSLVILPDIHLNEPSEVYCILSWIQGNLTAKPGTEFPTLDQVYSAGSRDMLGESPRRGLWETLTPRTHMFGKLFNSLKSVRNHVEMVVAMHECGFTPQVLETLPEAILTPLQDVIFMCQPSPPPSWPKDLLKLVNRTDIGDVLQLGKAWKGQASETQVR